SAGDLEKQAGRFDPVVLTQDITILEDLRRQLRQTQAGRALLDATLVRLALAEQFTSIGELLGQVESGSASSGAGQKKKFEQIIEQKSEVRSQKSEEDTGEAPVPQAVPVAVEEEEDDDLPQPGRPWTGPSLAEALKAGPVVLEAKPVVEKSNVEVVDEKDLPAVWRKLLDVLKSENRPSLASIVEQGELVAMDEYQATLRYSADRQTFFNLMGRNGKKELVGEVISRLIGRAVGVKLELDAKPSVKAEPLEKTVAASAKADSTGTSVIQRMPEARLTPEQMAEAQKRPLVAALMKKFDASIVRISEE
ncbi:MAG TPA: hypothetical protein VGP94_01495, partial [Tepidisphaeraceae bacterium]|nr:hypothetical protein [Tepidisphaeraceae bacterium]